MGAQGEGESDELKRVLLEGNPYFLGLTTLVSILHSVFDLLAFKNDIGFWRGKKNVEGLSVRTVGINCACQVRAHYTPPCLLLLCASSRALFMPLADSRACVLRSLSHSRAC
jgi:hypothetical protein